MCGIAGIYRRGAGPIAEARLRVMQEDLLHRGPDASGLKTGPHIGLAATRLAIIDLSASANQPMLSNDQSTWMAFNGEIYNFHEIRRQLEAKERRFRTHSDTEVILQGYEEWGLDVFARLNGMFAVALWDARHERLHLARDRFGKKPLFYTEANGEVVFASEVRTVVRGLEATPPVDPQALDLFLTYLVVPGDRSVFSGIRKVPPASILTFSRQGVTIDRYWRLSLLPRERCTEPEALERLDELLTNAVRIRMESDVPLGVFLSGGVDSSIIVALMSKASGTVRTFSLGLANGLADELPYARSVASACGTAHEELVLGPEAADILPRLVWHHGEPFADSSAVPSFCLSAAARREVTVTVHGEGGDDAFAGYRWFRTIRAAERYRAICPAPARRLLSILAAPAARSPEARGAVHSFARLVGNWGRRTAADAFWIWPGFSRADRRAFYQPSFLDNLGAFDPALYSRRIYESTNGLDDVDRALQVGLETYLSDDLLVKVDITSMANSTEARCPFLDDSVVDFAARLPPRLKVKGLRTKHLLKTYAAKLVPGLAVNRPKCGFSIPIASWLRGPLRRPLEAILGHPRFHARGYLDRDAVRACIGRHMAGEDHGEKLWSLLCFELWFRVFIDRDVGKDDCLRELG